jgi:hypothetical protein
MSKAPNYPSPAPQQWKHLVEAAILETNTDTLSRRIQAAQDAVMDRIEDTFEVATQPERQALINAMNSLRELRRLIEVPASDFETNPGDFTDA